MIDMARMPGMKKSMYVMFSVSIGCVVIGAAFSPPATPINTCERTLIPTCAFGPWVSSYEIWTGATDWPAAGCPKTST